MGIAVCISFHFFSLLLVFRLFAVSFFQFLALAHASSPFLIQITQKRGCISTTATVIQATLLMGIAIRISFHFFLLFVFRLLAVPFFQFLALAHCSSSFLPLIGFDDIKISFSPSFVYISCVNTPPHCLTGIKIFHSILSKEKRQYFIYHRSFFFCL